LRGNGLRGHRERAGRRLDADHVGDLGDLEAGDGGAEKVADRFRVKAAANRFARRSFSSASAALEMESTRPISSASAASERLWKREGFVIF